MLISDAYRDLNVQLHRDSAAFGSRGQKWAPRVAYLAAQSGCRTILDYGCGKSPISVSGLDVRGYDPAVFDHATRPEPADLLVCTDVLEHVEPGCLEAVLSDIRALARWMAFLVIATRPSDKFLADGRNAHLIVEPMPWWQTRLLDAGFLIREARDNSQREYWAGRADVTTHSGPRPYLMEPGREFWVVAI